MHPYELLACFALISSVLVCVVLHPFRKAHGIYQEFPLDWPFSGWGHGGSVSAQGARMVRARQLLALLLILTPVFGVDSTLLMGE